MKKRLISVAAAITASFILTAAALAAAEFANIHELFGYWAANGYPDYFSSVCAADGDKAELMVFLTDPDAEDTIREMLVDDSGLVFRTDVYSYSELVNIMNEIVDEYVPVHELSFVGIGWGRDGGFGPTGKASRVVVGVLEDHVQKYADLFCERYGDAVVVTIGGRNSLTSDLTTDSLDSDGTSAEEEKRGTSPIAWLAVTVLVGALAAVGFWGRESTAANKSPEEYERND